MLENWSEGGDSFTTWLWNCGNVLIRVEARRMIQIRLSYKILILGHLKILPWQWWGEGGLKFSVMGGVHSIVQITLVLLLYKWWDELMKNHIQSAGIRSYFRNWNSVRKIQKGHFITKVKLKKAPLVWSLPMFIASL